MYELVKVTEHCYYFESPAKIGLVDIGDGNVVLIDSGNDKDAGKNKALIYTAGDMHSGQSLVVRAIAEGRSAAREVDLDLMGYTNL